MSRNLSLWESSIINRKRIYLTSPFIACGLILLPMAETWRRVWGDGNFFRGRPSFLFIDQVFGIFPSLFPDFPDLYFVRCRTQPFPHNKNTFLTLFSYFRAHPTTLLLTILGGRMHGPSPHLKLWGTVPPVPLGFRPCCCHQSCFRM